MRAVSLSVMAAMTSNTTAVPSSPSGKTISIWWIGCPSKRAWLFMLTPVDGACVRQGRTANDVPDGPSEPPFCTDPWRAVPVAADRAYTARIHMPMKRTVGRDLFKQLRQSGYRACELWLRDHRPK